MKGRIVAIGASLVAVMALVVAFAPAVLAQTPGQGNGTGNPNGNANGNGQGAYGPGMRGGGMNMRSGMGMGMGMMGSGNSLIAVAADKLGMTTADLVTALGGTKSIAQVASEHNVAPNTIIDAFLAPRITNLNAAVAAGKIMQAQADQMLATMRTNVTEQLNEVWTARGPGQGTGTGYTDADGDGICDNMPTGGHGMMNRGQGNRP